MYFFWRKAPEAPHGDKAGTAAQKVGYSFCPEYSVGAKTRQSRQQDGEGNDDDRFPEQGKEGGISGFAESHKDALSCKLQGHKAESEKVNVQGGDALGQQIRIVVENPDEKCRDQFQNPPHK